MVKSALRTFMMVQVMMVSLAVAMDADRGLSTPEIAQQLIKTPPASPVVLPDDMSEETEVLDARPGSPAPQHLRARQRAGTIASQLPGMPEGDAEDIVRALTPDDKTAHQVAILSTAELKERLQQMRAIIESNGTIVSISPAERAALLASLQQMRSVFSQASDLGEERQEALDRITAKLQGACESGSDEELTAAITLIIAFLSPATDEPVAQPAVLPVKKSRAQILSEGLDDLVQCRDLGTLACGLMVLWVSAWLYQNAGGAFLGLGS